ncbi:MAG TPA: rhomboid family intramembrane serine protease [Myxococcaceae bacterium]|nr:rhomboid family intramembrane serine protease [Myxococcaceae bacterium]
MEPTPTPPPVPAPRPPPPLVSWIYLGICVLLFLPHAMAPEPPDKYLLYGPAVAAGEWWRVLTSNFEHVTPLHILFNGLSIFSFGPVVERQVGSARMLIVSLTAALLSSATALIFMWHYPSAGASGVIAGWLGLALPIADARARKVLIQWTILLVLVSLVPRVAWAAHLGGFIGGLVPGLLIRAAYRKTPRQPFRSFDRLALPLLVLATAAVVLVVFVHTGLRPGSVQG